MPRSLFDRRAPAGVDENARVRELGGQCRRAPPPVRLTGSRPRPDADGRELRGLAWRMGIAPLG